MTIVNLRVVLITGSSKADLVVMECHEGGCEFARGPDGAASPDLVAESCWNAMTTDFASLRETGRHWSHVHVLTPLITEAAVPTTVTVLFAGRVLSPSFEPYKEDGRRRRALSVES